MLDCCNPVRRRAALPRAVFKAHRCWAMVWAVVVVCLLGAAPALGEEDDYALGTGDRLRVTVFGQPDLSGEFEVDSSGRLNLPLAGSLEVVNRSPNDVRQMIVAALQPDYLKDPQVSVQVINYRHFYIIGEVANPGSYPYVGGMRVVNAVAVAGGFTYRADEDDLRITRARGDGKQEEATKGTLVMPGDVIEVTERFF
jgi:protein involved in polysaccharide export with SLBB domain